MIAALAVLTSLMGAGPDLQAHFREHDGLRRLSVSREQWEGIRRSLYQRDRTTLAALISEKQGITAAVRTPGTSNRGNAVEIMTSTRLTRDRFLAIGPDADYNAATGVVSNASTGDSVYFKWLWQDLARIEQGGTVGDTNRKAYDALSGTTVWELFGWRVPAGGGPTSRVSFAAEGDRLIIVRIDVSGA